MRIRKLFLSFLGMLMISTGLSGCKEEELPSAESIEEVDNTQTDGIFEKGAIPLYFTNEAFDKVYIFEQEFDFSGKNMNRKIRGILGALRDEKGEICGERNWHSVIPEGVIFKAEYQENQEDIDSGSKIIIEISRMDGQMTQNQKVVMYTGISRSLLALKIASSVEFIDEWNGQVLYTAWDTQEVSVNEYGEEFFSDTVAVNLYFSNRSGTALRRERRELFLGVTDSLAKAVIQALIAGPAEAGSVATIPSGTFLNDIFIKDNVCYLDLSGEFQRNYIGGETAEKLTVYSVVNSLCGVPGINKVQILIDGKRVDTYKFSISLNSFFERDLTIVE